MSNKPKLHELLAVETNLENQAAKTRNELIATFNSKRHLFEEKRVIFTPNAENAQAVTETQSAIQSNIKKELAWVQGFIVKALDASFQVAEANTNARADIVLEDESNTVLATNVPATALLELEKRLTEIAAVVNAIPTLDPAKGFTLDSNRNLYAAREVTKTRTKKVKAILVKYQATKEHPAQVESYDADEAVGKITEQEWSGLITPVEKAELIDRVEIVARAVRRARSRANDQEIDTSKRIGNQLLKYIFKS